ncbi:MAG: flagellar motor protein MotB [Thermodesulforhabdaceae bacterium]
MSLRKSSQHNPDYGTKKPAWIITYADLCTLLLTFFVLIFSMSSIDEEREKKALNSLIGAFGFLPAGKSLSGEEKPENIPIQSIPMTKPSSMDEKLLKQLAATGMLGPEADILREEDRLMIRLNAPFLFDEGSSKLSPLAEKLLSNLGMHLKNDPQDVEIRAYTDKTEVMATPNSESLSWKISAERAFAVYRLFLNLGIAPQRMSAHGMSYFHPVVDIDQFPSLKYKNRRVEILLGKNPSIPASIYSMKAERKPFFQYKHFFFPLFGGESGHGKK